MRFTHKPLHEKSFERERQITATASEVRFLMDDSLKAKIEDVKALLGPKAVGMSFAELVATMAELSTRSLSEKKFGKKRVRHDKEAEDKIDQEGNETAEKKTNHESTAARSSESKVVSKTSPNARYVSKSLKYEVWQRDRGTCTQCSSRKNLNFDHILPVGFKGETRLDNLRLLCASCNQRAAIRVYGVEKMERYRRI